MNSASKTTKDLFYMNVPDLSQALYAKYLCYLRQ